MTYRPGEVQLFLDLPAPIRCSIPSPGVWAQDSQSGGAGFARVEDCASGR
jgi:hypothetical protein